MASQLTSEKYLLSLISVPFTFTLRHLGSVWYDSNTPEGMNAHTVQYKVTEDIRNLCLMSPGLWTIDCLRNI